MIRVLFRCGVDPNSRLRWLVHPDPEALEEAAAAFDREGADRSSLSTDFSRVVSSIRIGRVHKLTCGNRLDEANHALGRFLAERGGDPVRLLDVGASDGTTTLDMVHMLESTLRVEVQATLMDRYTRLECRGRGPIREYRMPDGSPVMLRLGPIGLQLSSLEATRDPVSRWLGRAWLSRRARRESMPLARTLGLISPAVREARIRVLEWNALEGNGSLAGGFDAIRASNVLNESYFSRGQIEQILAHLHSYLKADGLLLVSRNLADPTGELDQGSLWKRNPGGFERVHDYGGGSYVAAIVDELRLPTAAAEAR